MKSTGEVMGVGETFGEAFSKAMVGAGEALPKRIGKAFVSVRDADKPGVVDIARQLIGFGFEIVSTTGTGKVLEAAGLAYTFVNKVNEGRPDIVDLIKNRDIDLIINTTEGRQAIADSSSIRRAGLAKKVCYTTTLAGADALCKALAFGEEKEVRRLQDIHKKVVR
jgi:carbamoyl-phosphate synthase large subunit